jgi:ketosteroid isomerase-like protein
MTREDVQRWLDAYVDAWRTYDPDAIGALFATDATYRYHAYDEPLAGRDAIVADWLDARDDPGSWTAHYEPYAIDGDRVVAVGESRYLEPDGSLRTIYYNLWTLRFDGAGQCVDFVEYFNELPERLRGTIDPE